MAMREDNAPADPRAADPTLLELAAQEGRWCWERSTDRVWLSPRCAEMLGRSSGASHGSVDLLFAPVLSSDLAEFQARLAGLSAGEIEVCEMDLRVVLPDGDTRVLRLRAVACERGAEIAGSLVDITAFTHAASTAPETIGGDPLTGAARREHFVQTLRTLCEDTARADGPADTFAVLLLDLNRFKTINEMFGHDAADDLLRAVADRLRDSVRSHDVVARFSGDEFAVLLQRIASDDDADTIATRIAQALLVPYDIGEHHITCVPRIGMTTSADLPDDEGVCVRSAEAILANADAALSSARVAPAGTVCRYNAAVHGRVRQLRSLEQDIMHANLDREFAVVYQPIVSLATGLPTGFEALVRWNHPTRGPVSPDMFIDIAETTGRIVPLGMWVLRAAAAQLRAWRDLGLADDGISVNVNVSKRQLVDAAFLDELRSALAVHNLPTDAIKLEVTESTIMHDCESISAVLDRVRELGFRLAMDDFGTGHSSLSCLHQFPIDVLKIDRTFIARLEQGRAFSAVVGSIVSLARHLDLAVVAEGVETEAHLAQLQAMDCEFAQGYFFSRPLAAADASVFLRNASGRLRRAA